MVSFSTASPAYFFWRQGLSLKRLELHSLCRLVDQQALRILQSVSPRAGFPVCTTAPLSVAARGPNQVLGFAQQPLTD